MTTLITSAKRQRTKRQKITSNCATGAVLGFFLFGLMVVEAAQAGSSGSSAIEAEAKRLKVVRELVRREAATGVTNTEFSTPGTKGPDCKQMLGDLLAGRGFRAIEPVAVLPYDYYPINRSWPNDQSEQKTIEAQEQVNEKLLGNELTQKIKWCASEPTELGGRHLEYFEGLHPPNGMAPYRIYKLPNSINPLPRAELFFWASSGPKGQGYGGHFSWVDLTVCSYVGGMNQALSGVVPSSRKTALTRYGDGLATWNIVANTSFEVEYKKRGSEDHLIGKVCTWTSKKQ